MIEYLDETSNVISILKVEILCPCKPCLEMSINTEKTYMLHFIHTVT